MQTWKMQAQLRNSSSSHVSSSRQQGRLPTGRPNGAARLLLLQTPLTHRLYMWSLHHLTGRVSSSSQQR
jgi:hypothetical protein